MALFGAFTPIEARPKWVQPFTHLNPIAALRFARADRAGARGAGLEVVYVQLLALGVIASELVGFTARKFRGQMSKDSGGG